ncbi:MAG: membrane protein insertion efficiency factor YidD [Patescibacteria group bacterium]
MRKFLLFIWHIPRNSIAFLITCYQHTLSPDHGPLKELFAYGYCRHEPTCSEYGKRAIRDRGVIVGVLLLSKRLLTCHPWRKPSSEKILKTSLKSSQDG